MYLVTLGTLKDVDPANIEDVFVQDIDFTFASTELCFRWSGFNHPSSEITFQLGVGSSKSSADIVSLSLIGAGLTQYCFTLATMTHLDLYYGILIASTDSGQVTQSSDGIRFVDSDYELLTAQVHDGPGCFDARTEQLSFSDTLHNGDNIEETINLTIGRWYTFELVLTDDSNIPSNQIIAVDVSVDGNSLDIAHTFHLNSDGKRHVYASVFATHSSSQLLVTNNLGMDIQVEAFLLKLCAFDVDYHSSPYIFKAWWNFYFEDTITPYVTHYEVSLEEESANETSSSIAGYKSSHLDTHYTFTGLSLIPGQKYLTVVRACMQHICMAGIKSDGFQVFPDEPEIGAINANMDFFYDKGTEANLTITIEWEPFVLPNEENHDFLYVYTVSTSPAVANHITEWHTYEGRTDLNMLQVITSYNY